MADIVEVVFTSDSSEQHCNACVWDPRAGTELMSYKGGVSVPHTLCLLANDYLISAEQGKPTVKVWALNSKEQTQLRMVCPGQVNALNCTPDGFYIAAGIKETLYIWQTSTGHLLATVKAHYQTINCVAFTGDGAFLISAGEDCQLLVWDMSQLIGRTSLVATNLASEATPKYSFNHHTHPIFDVCVGMGGVQSLMASVSIDKSCKIYSLASGTLLLNLVFPVGLTSVAMNACSSQIFVGSCEGKIYSYNLTSAPRTPDYHLPEEYPAVFHGHEEAVMCLSVSIDGTLLISGSKDEKAIIWDVASRQQLRSLPHKGAVLNAFFVISPKHVFSQELKPSIVLKTLLRHSGNEETKAVDVIIRGTPRKSPEQAELEKMLEVLKMGDIPLQTTFGASNQDTSEIHEAKKSNKEIYLFALEKLLKPQESVPQETTVVTEKPIRENGHATSSNHNKAKKRKRKNNV